MSDKPEPYSDSELHEHDADRFDGGYDSPDQEYTEKRLRATIAALNRKLQLAEVEAAEANLYKHRRECHICFFGKQKVKCEAIDVLQQRLALAIKNRDAAQAQGGEE